MDKSCGLQRVARCFVRYLRGRKLAQFVINQRQQLIGSFRVALQKRIKNPRDVAHALTVATCALGPQLESKEGGCLCLMSKMSNHPFAP